MRPVVPVIIGLIFLGLLIYPKTTQAVMELKDQLPRIRNGLKYLIAGKGVVLYEKDGNFFAECVDAR